MALARGDCAIPLRKTLHLVMIGMRFLLKELPKYTTVFRKDVLEQNINICKWNKMPGKKQPCTSLDTSCNQNDGIGSPNSFLCKCFIHAKEQITMDPL